MNNIIHKYLNYIIVISLSIFSFIITIYFGFIGVNPFDNFASYHAAFENLNGKVPFRDYWEAHGPLLDFIQLAFFKIFGISWLSYTLHAGTINLLFTIIFYYVLRNFGLDRLYSLFYSLSLSAISNTQAGTPYYDHHAIIFSLIGLLLTFLSIKNHSRILIFFVPLVFLCAFLIKQTPSIYLAFLVVITVFYDCIATKKYSNIIYIFFGFLFSLVIFFTIIKLLNIRFEDFYYQYIKFASSIGTERINSDSFIFPINFSRYFIKYKLMHLAYFVMLFVLINNIIQQKKYYINQNFIFIISLILVCYILIFHQMLTLNVKYVYFYIPILIAFSHIFALNSKYIKLLSSLTIILCLVCTSYYFLKYIDKRKFLVSSQNFSKNKIYETKIIDNQYNFKWITNLSLDTQEEVENLEIITSFFNQESKKGKNYIIITDYQFIMTNLKDNKNIFIGKWFNPGVSHPKLNSQLFERYKKYLDKKIFDNNVNKIFFVYPSWFKEINKSYFKEVFSNCLTDEKVELKGLIESINIQKCY